MISQYGRDRAYNISQESTLYTCEILFDDWEHVDDILHDKDVHVVFCARVFPRGVHDRRDLSKIIVAKDERDYHFPAVRLIFNTTSKYLYDNTYRTIGISYIDKHWYHFTYSDFIEAKTKNVGRSTYFLRFKNRLLNKFIIEHNDSINKMIEDEDWWTERYEAFVEEDRFNDIFGVKMNPINDSSAKNLSKFKTI